MDNRFLDVVSQGGVELIDAALSLIWHSAAPGTKATHYRTAPFREEHRYYIREIDPEKQWGNVADRPTLSAHRSSQLVHSSTGGVETLILLWHEEGAMTVPLPFPLDRKQSAQFIVDWLKQVPRGDQPDHDGSNSHGWRLFTEAWGHVAGHSCAIVGVQPAWAMYGK